MRLHGSYLEIAGSKTASKTTMKTRILIILAILMNVSSLYAQFLNDLDNYLQSSRIGLVDEFFKRFNGTETHPSVPIEADNSRENNLKLLFNLEMFKKQDDSIASEANQLIMSIQNDNTIIQYKDTTWFAIAHCKGTLDKKSVDFDIILTVEHRRKNMYKWVITKVQGDLFNCQSSNPSDNIMLHPDDHETNFISLRRLTNEQPGNVSKFISKTYSYDATSVFHYLVYHNKLKIEYVEELEFVFTQVPDYIFHVKYFDREAGNAGWLISNFYHVSKAEKDSSLKYIYSDARTEPVEKYDVEIEPLATDKAASGSEKLFHIRTNERISHLKDYLSYIQYRKMSDNQFNYYVDKIKELFDDKAMVIVADKIKNKTSKKNIAEFCEAIRHPSKQRYEIESVIVPVWDNRFIDRREKITAVSSHIIKTSELGLDIAPQLEINSQYQTEVVFEQTEDGPEWLPLFGDITITMY